MIEINYAAFGVFLSLAAWQDLKERQISVWLYLAFGILALLLRLANFKEVNWADLAGGAAIGLGLLIVSRATKGAIGDGDGYFFLVSGIYLGLWNNVALLFHGLLFCGIYCLAIMAVGVISKLDVRQKRVPFLPFLFLAGVWMVLAWKKS